MFQKQANQEPEKPRLQGEDFDIFPDLGDRYAYKNDGAEESKAEPGAEAEPREPEAPPEPTEFEKRIAALSPSAWKKLQIAGGALLGVLSGLCMTVLSDYKTFSGYGLIVAVVLALLVPNLIEKKVQRSISAGRIALIAALAVTMGIYLVYGLMNPPQ